MKKYRIVPFGVKSDWKDGLRTAQYENRTLGGVRGALRHLMAEPSTRLATGFPAFCLSILMFSIQFRLSAGKSYSFAIFGDVLALSELQMCMAFSVGVVQPNYSAVTIIPFAVALFLLQ